MLFPETSEYLGRYIKNNPTENGTIFYYKNVSRKTLLDDIGEMFREFKNSLPKSQLKQVEDVTQKYLRKSFRTTAKKARCHIEYIKLVMGRKLEGSEEFYTDKDAKMTQDVIQAVYDYYFGKQKE